MNAQGLVRDRLRCFPMKRTLLSHISLAAQTVVVFCAYFFAAHYALLFNPFHDFAVFFWPAAGIGLAALFFLGYRLAPAIAAAAFLANYLNGAPVLVALAIAAGNSFEAVASAYLLKRTGFDPLFKRLKDGLLFTAVALLTGLSAAIIGTTALSLVGLISAVGFPLTLLVWWIGDSLGILVAASFLIRWLVRPIQLRERTLFDVIENIVFFFALSFAIVIIFLDPIPDLNSTQLLYLTFVPITWGALRIGPRAMTLAVGLITALAIVGTLFGGGPFFSKDLSDIFLLQAYLGTVTIISLLFVATVEERKDAMHRELRHVVELQEDVEDLSTADKAKNDFIAILSHELRNPLAPVVSSLELLRLNVAQMPQFKDTIDAMHDQVGRITRLLDDLLDIARISRKKFNLQVARTNLQDVLAHSVTMVEVEMRKRGHAFTSRLPETPIWIEGDSLRLEQVFVNLLNNAAKYTDVGGKISLTALARGDTAEIRVHDSGIGIAPQMLQAIFEPFRQAHPAGRESAGLGIGLSLAKRFIELHGGSIGVESEGPGKGSEFIVRLPVAKTPLLTEGSKSSNGHASSPAGEVRDPASPPSGSGLATGPRPRLTVLIVDDNLQAAEGIAKLLNHAGHVARTAHDGASALHTLASFRPEIIFLDIGLPDGSGYELAQKIRQYLSPQPIIVALTGYGQEEDKQRAHEEGFDAHLTKPVSIADLEKVMEKA